MKRVAIVFDSQEGQSERIAARIATRLRSRACLADLFPTDAAVAGLGQYDGVVAGGSVHMGRHGRRLVRFVRQARADLERLPSAFFSVSLSAASADAERHAQADRAVEAFRAETGWTPGQEATFAGALRFSRYGLLKRLLMRRVAASEGSLPLAGDTELTDWDAVDAFADAFLARLPDGVPA